MGLITHIPSILLQRIKILQYFYLSTFQYLFSFITG
ncbi:hypothetical protein BACOVA_05395 [Bacteroides ovatus ATCC 8483]|uniref:Uncharacterized protein n=1 Tax=Bacteroides ovatus (strain ATCC 8483 / DSM 1896 / JCM 5824 / BCRC 10623 / CCUG 4943 / NCTC 11153) TaxID=411476 RepID=A0AAN3D5I3_BACO1|nr:hypothetical protein BACOVA_05395 [Bacteroides ovatus ATCC 8483]